MKKIFLYLIIVVFVIVFTCCSKNSDNSTSKEDEVQKIMNYVLIDSETDVEVIRKRLDDIEILSSAAKHVLVNALLLPDGEADHFWREILSGVLDESKKKY